MTIAEILEKMICYSNGNIHDIDHLVRVWTFAKTIGELEHIDAETQYILSTKTASILSFILFPPPHKNVRFSNYNHKMFSYKHKQ